MKRAVLAIFSLTLPLLAQTTSSQTEPPHRVTKLFVLKYADPERLYNSVRIFPDTQMIPNKEMHTLSVSGNSTQMPAIEDAINRLDVPASAPKNIDLTVYLIIGGEAEGTVPKDLEPVVAQLKNAFPFKAYRLMDLLTLRTRTGQRASTQSSGGAIYINGRPVPVETSFRINSANTTPDGNTVRLDGMSANSKVPYDVGNGFSFRNLGLDTDIDIKEGQKVVVGRLGIERNQALFLVLTAHIVQ